MNNTSTTAKKLTGSIAVAILLAACLVITSAALVYATLSIDNSFFSTGSVEINLNDGQPIIQQHEFLFEPGMTVEKKFFVENESSCDIFYRLYFDNLDGGLANVIEVTVSDDERVLYSCLASELTRERVGAAQDILNIAERRELTIRFHYPETANNSGQGADMSFDMCADAVQSKNNPNRLFN